MSKNENSSRESDWEYDGEYVYNKYGRKVKKRYTFNESLDRKVKDLVSNKYNQKVDRK